MVSALPIPNAMSQRLGSPNAAESHDETPSMGGSGRRWPKLLEPREKMSITAGPTAERLRGWSGAGGTSQVGWRRKLVQSGGLSDTAQDRLRDL